MIKVKEEAVLATNRLQNVLTERRALSHADSRLLRRGLAF
jgi:hypothetical protein